MFCSRPGRLYSPHYHLDDDYKEDNDDNGSDDHDVDANSDKVSLTWFLQERKLRCLDEVVFVR